MPPIARGAARARDCNEVEGGVGLDRAREIDEEKCRALEHANHDQLFAVEVTGDLSAHLGDALGNLLAGIKDVEALIGHGGHGDSIARIALGLAVKIGAEKRKAADGEKGSFIAWWKLVISHPSKAWKGHPISWGG